MRSRWITLGTMLMLAWAEVAVAQPSPRQVGILVLGEGAAEVAETLSALLEEPPVRWVGRPPDDVVTAVAFVVTIDTDAARVEVRAFSSGSTLERRMDGPQDGYALALIAAELLELARSGADPSTLSAAAVQPPEGLPRALRRAELPTLDAAPSRDALLALTFAAGLHVWGGWEGSGIVLAQPTIIAELLVHLEGAPWSVGGAIALAGLGTFTRQGDAALGRYGRHEVAVRLSAGSEVGSLGTQVLAYLGLGVAAVSGSGTLPSSGREVERWSDGWSVGGALEIRQPLYEGLVLALELGVDALPAPIRFTALGEPLLVEPSARLGGRLWVGWCFR